MTLVIETGSGIRTANCYINPAFVTQYLTSRNRQTENSWSTLATNIQNAACIAGTDFIEKRFGLRFRGIRQFEFEEEFSTGRIVVYVQVADGDTLTIGDEVFTFRSTPGTSDFDVTIGGTQAATAANLAAAITATGARHSSAEVNGANVTLTATAPGSSGDLTELSSSTGNLILTQFTGGVDGGSQPLSFPRICLVDQSGNDVKGIPLKLKQANAEYAVRAAEVGTSLISDPTVDIYAGSIKRRMEKVGPIEEEFEYVDGTHLSTLIKPYPAADKLLTEYLLGFGTGGVIR